MAELNPAGSRGSTARPILFLLLLLLPSLLFATGQSLWIDEAASCWFADHGRIAQLPDFPWLAAAPQMPLFHLLLMGWVRIVGDSERALRSFNLPFAALFLGSIAVLCRQRAGPRWWLAVAPFAVFPLLTYYVNQCRPYVAILALSTAAAAAYLCFLRSRSRSAAFLCAAFAMCAFGMHFLGGLAAVVLLLYSLGNGDARRLLAASRRQWAGAVAWLLPGYFALIVYYARIRGSGLPNFRGIAPSETPGKIASNWKNLGFFFYELLGFGGLGPPRDDLRVHAGIALLRIYLPWLLAGAASLAAIAAIYLRNRRAGSGEEARSLVLAATAGLLVLFAMARAIHLGFLDRHAIALAGIFCVAFALSLCNWLSAGRGGVWAAAILMLIWGLSSARMLFLYRYGQDDARAALSAAQATGLPILWDANVAEAAYYGGFDPQETQSTIYVATPGRRSEHWKPRTPLRVSLYWDAGSVERLIRGLPPGRYAMVSGRPDVFDPEGVWQQIIAQGHPVLLNQFNGFRVQTVTLQGAAETAER